MSRAWVLAVSVALAWAAAWMVALLLLRLVKTVERWLR